MLTAGVAVDKAGIGYDMLYTYIVPDSLKNEITVGSRVTVPFGRGDKKRVGVVLELGESEDASSLKAISEALPRDISLGSELAGLVKWLRDNTFCTYFEAAKAVLPPGFAARIAKKYTLCEKPDGLTKAQSDFFDSLSGMTAAQRDKALSAEENSALTEELLQAGAVIETERIKRRIGDDTVKMAELTEEYLTGSADLKLTPKQKAAVSLLEQYKTALVSELCEECKITEAVIKNLVKAGVVAVYESERPIEAEAAPKEKTAGHLSEKQAEVFDGISRLISSGKPEACLLHGVTGSGKTQIYLELIDYTLKLGKNAIMLIPEISLTPQVLLKFRERFGGLVAVIHSGLSMGQRVEEYKKIRSGGARIAVGTRSAIFAPMENIGLIIMDEEGESTYKSESTPRYNTKDVARQRCIYNNATLLLASATPSIDSYYKAKTGKYHLFELAERYNSSVLPEVYIVDMKPELDAGNTSQISTVLKNELLANLKNGEQSILLLNRRGYHTYASCMSCREPIVCPNCNIALTYHKTGERVVCHYCGYSKPMPKKCEKCGGEYIKLSGAGTQKIEDELHEICPNARILRMDADTTCSRFAYERSFAAFGRGEYDIMVGTQMIAKGLDFPNVTLVGVLSVDKSLYSGDYKSYERTFSLVTQVVGRGGRGSRQGRAYIQTFSPDHYVINLAAMQDYKAFYEEEAAIRKALLYPPYCNICVVGFTGADEAAVKRAAVYFTERFAQAVSESKGVPVRILGPAKAVLARINNKFRYKTIIKCINNMAFRETLRSVLTAAAGTKEFAKIGVYVDPNGDIGL